MFLTIIAGIISIIGFVLLFMFMPYRLWTMKISVIWGVLIFLITTIIIFLWIQVIPLTGIITLRKTILSLILGVFHFILFWLIFSIDVNNMIQYGFLIATSQLNRAAGALFIGYALYSTIFLLYRVVSKN